MGWVKNVYKAPPALLNVLVENKNPDFSDALKQEI